MSNSFSISPHVDIWGNWDESDFSEIYTRFHSQWRFCERPEWEITVYEAAVLTASYSQLCPTPLMMLDRVTCNLFIFFFSFFLTSLYIAGVTQLLSAQGSGTSCCRMLPFCSKCIFFSPCGLEQFDARKGHAAFWSVFLPLQSKAALREASKGSWSVLQGWEQGRLAGSVLVLPVSSRKESNTGTHLALGTSCA